MFICHQHKWKSNTQCPFCAFEKEEGKSEEPKSNDSFWTDELVQEYCGNWLKAAGKNENYISIQSFKQYHSSNEVCGVDINWAVKYCHGDLSKVMKAEDCRFIGTREECHDFVKKHKPQADNKPDRDWEIVEYFDEKGDKWRLGKMHKDFTSNEMMESYYSSREDGKGIGVSWFPASNKLDFSKIKIHSVKRLSDGVTFSIGDEVESIHGSLDVVIDSFYITKDNEMCCLVLGGVQGKYTIDRLRHAKKLPPQKQKGDELNFIHGKKYSWAGHFHGVNKHLPENMGIGYIFNDCGKLNTLFSIKDKEVLERLFWTVDETMVCPATGKHCDDECCTVSSECNLKSDDKISAPQPQKEEQGVCKSDTGHCVNSNVCQELDKCMYVDREEKSKKQKLFTTEDGVGIFIGDVYWYFDSRMKLYSIKVVSVHDIKKGEKQFSTQEAAEKYIADNKPKPLSTLGNVVSGYFDKNDHSDIFKEKSKPQEQRIEVFIKEGLDGVVVDSRSKGYLIIWSHPFKQIPKEKIPEIKQSIEQILNDEPSKDFVETIFKKYKAGEFYTQQQVDELCEKAKEEGFSASRKTQLSIDGNDVKYRYNDFEDYKNKNSKQ